jgi:tetratricopeptide (TPR) repeat protein
VRNRLRLCAIAISLVLALPAGAAAQKDDFVDAFVALSSALPATYGDESARVSAEFARMAAALETWDRTAAAAEAALKKRAATPGEFALHYVEHQRIELALNAMNAAVAAEPTRASLYIFQGQLLEALGRVADAIAAFAKARQLDPDDPLAAYFVATRSFGEAADLEPLIATLLAATDRRRALPERPFADLALVYDLSSKWPAFAPAGYIAAFRAFEARRYHDAVDEFRAAIARDPLIVDPAARSQALLDGVAALRAKNGDEALARLEAAVKAAPESSESRRVLGTVYRAIGMPAEAVAQFEIAVRLRPDDERARLALGATLAEGGDLPGAERALRAAIRALPTSGAARSALAEMLHEQSRGAEAIALLKEAVALPVVAGRVHLLWRLAELSHGYRRDYEHVNAMTTQRVRLVPNEAAGHKDLGLAYYRAGREHEAAIELTMTALLGLEDAETLGAMGQIHFNAGRLEQGLVALRRAVALDPKAMQARYVLAQTLQHLGRDAEAVQELDAFNKLRAAQFDEQRRQFEIDNRARTGAAQ